MKSWDSITREETERNMKLRTRNFDYILNIVDKQQTLFRFYTSKDFYKL